MALLHISCRLTPRVPEDAEGGHLLSLLGREDGGMNVVALGAGESIQRCLVAFHRETPEATYRSGTQGHETHEDDHLSRGNVIMPLFCLKPFGR